MEGDHEISGVKFESPGSGWHAVKYYRETSTPKMVQLVIKLSGGTLSEKQAEYVLFALAIIMVGASLYLFFGGSSIFKEKIIYPMPPAGVEDVSFRS